MSIDHLISRLQSSPVANASSRNAVDRMSILYSEACDAIVMAGTLSHTHGWDAGDSGRLLIDSRGSLIETLARSAGDLRNWSDTFSAESKVARSNYILQQAASTAIDWFEAVRHVLPKSTLETLAEIRADSLESKSPTSLLFVRENFWIPLLQPSGTTLPLRRLERHILLISAEFSISESFALSLTKDFLTFTSEVSRYGYLQSADAFVHSSRFTPFITDPDASIQIEKTAKLLLSAGGPTSSLLRQSDVDDIVKSLQIMLEAEGYLTGIQRVIDQTKPWERLNSSVSRALSAVLKINLYRMGKRNPDKQKFSMREKYGWIQINDDPSVIALTLTDPDAKQICDYLAKFAEALDGWENCHEKTVAVAVGGVFLTFLVTAFGYNVARLMNKSNTFLMWSMTFGGILAGAYGAWMIVKVYDDVIRRSFYRRFDEHEGDLGRSQAKTTQRCDNLRVELDELTRSTQIELLSRLEGLTTRSKKDWCGDHWVHFEKTVTDYVDLCDERDGITKDFMDTTTELTSTLNELADSLDEHRVRLMTETSVTSPMLPQHCLSLGLFHETKQDAVVYLNYSAPMLITSEPHGARAHSNLINALEPVIHQWIESANPDAIELILVDPVGMGIAFRDFIPFISRLGRHMPATVQYDEAMLESLWDRLQQTISSRTHKFLSGDSITINDHNMACVAESLSLERQIIVLINDFHLALPSSGIDLERILTNGPLCGVYPILLCRDILALEENKEIRAVQNLTVPLRFIADKPGRFRFGRESSTLGELGFDIEAHPHVSHREFMRTGEDHASELRVTALTMEALWERWRKVRPTRSKVGMEIPVGLAGNQLLSFDFGANRTESVHHIVVGGTGSGKSVLLHALIMSTIELYNADEVELFLFDFKPMGTEFSVYGEARPEHIKYVVAGAAPSVAVQVLSNVVVDIKHRARMFDEASLQNLDQYNESHPDAKLPRRIIIMDEFQSLMTHPSANHLIAEIARKGRSYGVHMVMASQTLANVDLDRQVLDQILTRMVLRCPPSALSQVVQADGFLSALSAGNGVVAVTSDFGIGADVEIGRVAYAQPHKPESRTKWTTGNTRVVDSKSVSLQVQPEGIRNDIIPWGLPVLHGVSPYSVRHRQVEAHAAFCSTDFEQRVRFIRSILKHRLISGSGDDIIILFSNPVFTQYSTSRDLLPDIGDQSWLATDAWPAIEDLDELKNYFLDEFGSNNTIIVLDADTGGFNRWFDSALSFERTSFFADIAKSGTTFLLMPNDPNLHRRLDPYCTFMGYGIGAYNADDSSLHTRWAVDEDNLFVRYDVANQKHEIVQFVKWQD